jgi:hypothetical protein
MMVLGQCKAGIDEVLRQPTHGYPIPPLWSLLSYAMLISGHRGNAEFWERYRSLKELAKNRDEHYRPIWIPKSNGTGRKLCVPDYFISVHQERLLREIFEALPVDEHAYAYRKGMGIRDCAAPHVGHRTLIHMDIRNFFSSIKEETVFACLLRDTGYSKGLVHFMSRVCCCKGALPQGACTSPILSNICFRECDEEIARYADAHGLAYSRYSDDMFFSGDIADPAAVIAAVTEILRERGYAVNRDKTRVVRQNNAQRVVGLTVNEKVQVSRDYRRQLRKEVYYVCKYGENAEGVKEAESYYCYLLRLQGKIAYVLNVDPENKEFQKARTAIWRMIWNMDSVPGAWRLLPDECIF